MTELTKRDLASGNYFHDSKGEIVEIVEFEWAEHWATVKYLDGIHAGTNIDCLTPIKLTAEILEKLNIPVQKHRPYLYDISIIDYELSITIDFSMSLCDNASFSGGVASRFQLSYVHQLQNIFYAFALTGKELEIKF